MIAVLMSGGVDSSVSAYLLKKQNFDIEGVTYKLFDSEDNSPIRDAKSVCDFLNIKHTVLDLSPEFKLNVINYFISEYCSGRTPNPCVMCNRTIKFGDILSRFDKVATGHYCQIEQVSGRYTVKRTNNIKDQSYYFCMLSQEQLKKIITPVSNLTKDQVRKIAYENNIHVHDKKDSQDICFIKESYKDFLKKYGVKDNPGNFMDEDGKILGHHNGIFNYTVGQRKGLNVSSNCRLYVKKIDHASNDIILSKRNSIKNIRIINLNFILFTKDNIYENVQVCVRYNCTPTDASIKVNDDEAIINFESPVYHACPGQFAVCYYKGFLALSGVIDEIWF